VQVERGWLADHRDLEHAAHAGHLLLGEGGSNSQRQSERGDKRLHSNESSGE
jgi:hypothetical protein